jgi:hypothetical protein
MTIDLLAFFTIWARPCQPVLLPTVTYIAEPWEVRVESADACGHVLQVFESVYLPHGETMNIVPMIDGARVWNAPNAWLSVEP